MTTTHVPASGPGALTATGTNPASQAHFRRCAADVERLRRLLAPISADRLSIVSGDSTDQSWTRLRRATFSTLDPGELDDRERLVLTAIALDHSLERSPVFTHGTARAILDLPSIG